MRILFVAHLFVPKHRAGVELYTAALAKTLAGRGHEIAVFHAEKEISRRHGEMLEESFDGHPRFRLINNLVYRSFDETTAWPAAERRFAEVLASFAPDVVHLHHLLFLSCGLPRLAKQSGARVVFTLHDFWLACPRFGQMRERGTSLCPGPEPERCSRCLGDFKLGQTRSERRGITLLGAVRRWTGVDLASRLEGRRKKPVAVNDEPSAAPPAVGRPDELPPISAADVARRRERLLKELECVDVFLSPSETVRRVVTDFGIPADRIEIARYGLDPAPFAGVKPARPRSPMRFAFVGTLAEHKGIHVVVDAFNRLPELPVTIWGADRYYPDYVARCQAAVTSPNITFAGELSRADLPKALADVDALIVPSIWYENSPFTIQEAFLAGIPVIASDLGGMAELVKHEVSGLLFEAGDAEGLSRAARRLTEEVGLYGRLLEGLPSVCSLDEDASELERRYAKS